MFTLLFAWRDSRRSRRRLLLFLSAMALGVAALVAIQSFSDQLSDSVRQQAREIAGADVNVYARRILSPEDERAIDSLATAARAETARQIVFTSMAYFPAGGGSRLTQVRATRGDFPFYGELATAPAEAATGYRQRGEALVDASLLLQFDAQVGDSIRIGNTRYRIAGRVDATTGQPDIEAFVAPRVYLPLEGLDPELTGFGSRVETNTYFRLPAGVDAEALVERAEPLLEERSLRAWTAAGVQSDWNDALGNLGRFLALVGFVALLLGGLGVASAVTVYVRQKTETVATLRCLGAPAGQALRAYTLQAAVLGFVAAVLGAAIGVAVQALLPRVLAPFLPVDVPFGVSASAILTGVGVGTAVALGFAMLPLLSVRHIPPLAAIRPGTAAAGRLGGGASRDPLRWAIVLVLGVGVGLFAWAQTGRPIAGVLFPLALAAALIVLAGASRLAMAGARRLLPRGIPYVWRQGLANLYRPGNQTLVLLTTLGLGTGLLLTLYLLQATLLGQIALPGGDARQPGLILFDIQREQVEEVQRLLRDEGAPAIETVPVVAMRVAAINGEEVASGPSEREIGADRDGWALRREYRSTYRDYLTDTERVTAGTFTPSVPAGDEPAPISLSADIADDLGVQLGDRITWDVAGVRVETTVGSLREVDWARVQPNFFAVFPRGPLDQAPQFNIITTRTGSAEEDAHLQRAIVTSFPNVSVVDVRLVLDVVQGVVDRVAFVLRFMALFALGTGLIVLAGAVRISRLARVEESVLLRTIGASRGQVRRILFAEYALLGLLAAIVGAGIALAGAAALATFAFDAALVPAWSALALAVIGLPVLTVVVGLAGSRGVLAQSPLAVLREAG
jgi:putative ABC transport system permease protein